MSFISFQNKQIHYKVSGRGDSVVVFLHGFLENLTMWNELTDELASSYTIIAVDLLGHGKTENIAEEHSMGLMAEAVSVVLENEQVNNFSIIGHSMGGYVALALAQQKPSEVKKVILLNSSAADDSNQKKQDRLRAIKVLEQGKRQFINEAIPNLFAEQNREKLSKEIANSKEIALQTLPEGISAALLGMRNRKSSIAWIKNSSTRVTFLCGELDSIIPLEKMKQQAKDTNSEIHIFNSSGHMSHLETKEECFKTIKQML